MLNDSGLPAYSYCEFTYAIGYQRMLYVDHANGNDDINDTRFLFVQFWASGERSFPKMGDSLPRTRINRRAKFYAASFIFAGEIHNRTNVQKTNKQWTMYPHIAYRLVWIKSNKKQKHICKRCIRSSYIHFVPPKNPSNFLFFEQLCQKLPILIFDMWNPEKIWHRKLINLSILPVRCSHFTLGNTKSHFQHYTAYVRRTAMSYASKYKTTVLELCNIILQLLLALFLQTKLLASANRRISKIESLWDSLSLLLFPKCWNFQ